MFSKFKQAISAAVSKYRELKYADATYPIEIYGRTRHVTLDIHSILNEYRTKHAQVSEAYNFSVQHAEKLKALIEELRTLGDEKYAALIKAHGTVKTFQDYAKKLSEMVYKNVTEMTDHNFHPEKVLNLAIELANLAKIYEQIEPKVEAEADAKDAFEIAPVQRAEAA